MAAPVDCPTCHGDGTVTVNPAYPDPQGAIDVRCDACDGTGEIEGSSDGELPRL